eukprot:g9082.t1
MNVEAHSAINASNVKRSQGRLRGSSIQKAKHGIKKVAKFYSKFQIDGIWFLWYLYFSEVLESAQQCINVVTIYSCSLPVAWTTSGCFGLGIECIHGTFYMISQNTPSRRIRQVKVDAAVDFVCTAIPLCALWFVYEVSISIFETTAITLLPTFTMLGKLQDILQEGVRQRSFVLIAKEERKFSFKAKRRRESLFEEANHLELARKQQETVPRRVRLLAGLCKGLFGAFFLVVAIAHLLMHPRGCNDKTWLKGCKNKIPFCNSLFTPTCNCAFLFIENDHTLTALPNNLTDEMYGLRRVFIRNCNLTKLPPRMEKLTEMVAFDLSFNNLQKFNVDVKAWKKLKNLYLDYNNITQHNTALWTHDTLETVALANNSVKIQFSGIHMPWLTWLHLGDNNMVVNSVFNKQQFPNLRYLYLNGNDLIKFPDESLKHSLIHIGFSRCNLNSLPLYLSNFARLEYIDARDNSITLIGNDLKTLIKKNNIESLFSGNPICKTDVDLDCKPLCSKTCWSRKALNDEYCDVECNTEECRFDGGDCA